MTHVKESENIMNDGSRKAFQSIRLLARAFWPGCRHRIMHAIIARNILTNPIERTAHPNPTLGCSWRNITGKMTAPTLDPIDAQPIAIGRFVVKLVDITTRAGIYDMPPPIPTQNP
jgi:hypothetical protein